MIGRTIGNYVVKTKIGEGGMGAVYAAEHPRIGRRVAIKVLHPELGKSPEIVARFFTEAKAANEIRNEHIIEILDFGELPDGISYFIMEWLDGKSLSTALEQEPKFPIARAMHTCRGIARALAAAHSKGIVHRDLKPDNVYLIRRGDDPDFVKVLDFGIAKLMTNDLSQGFKTQTGAIMGTPYYMSPEQCRGATKDIDHRTDIYALGCILYQMVTGQLPFNAEGLGELLLQHMTRPPVPPTQIDPTIPPEIENAILKALEKEPGKRWTSVTEMMNAAGAAMGNLTGPVALPSHSQVAPVVELGGRPPSIAPTPALKQTTMRGAAAEAVPATQPGGKSRRTFVVGGVVAGIAAVGLIVMLNRKPAAQPAQGPIAQPKIETPPPKVDPPKIETPPPAQPKIAHIKIHSTPADARLTLDNADIPAESSFPISDVRHELVVKAAGYRSERMWVVFDGDHDYNVPLKKGHGEHKTEGVAKAVTPPEVTAQKIETPPPERPPSSKAEPKVEKEKEKEKPGQPAYQGKKGKLITDFPDQ